MGLLGLTRDGRWLRVSEFYTRDGAVRRPTAYVSPPAPFVSTSTRVGPTFPIIRCEPCRTIGETSPIAGYVNEKGQGILI